MPQDKQLEWLKELWKQYNDYFKHKENLCHAIFLVEVALLASLIISPIPEWYEKWLKQLRPDCLSVLLSALPMLFLATLVVFLFQAHSLLLMQLRMRRAADAFGDAIGHALTKWAVTPPNAVELAPATIENLNKYFDGMHETNWFDKIVFPSRTERPRSNTDDLWHLLPDRIACGAVGLLRNSQARQFQETIAWASIILVVSGLVVFALRFFAYFSR